MVYWQSSCMFGNPHLGVAMDIDWEIGVLLDDLIGRLSCGDDVQDVLKAAHGGKSVRELIVAELMMVFLKVRASDQGHLNW